MSSIFLNKIEQEEGAFGKKINIPYFVQFVPGMVVDVFTHDQHPKYGFGEHVNTIIALPHWVDADKPPPINELNESHRYKPLFRGITEAPTKGDPVLLTSFGSDRYYIGPLNSQNNVNFNSDKHYQKEWLLDERYGKDVKQPIIIKSRNFDTTNQSRLVSGIKIS